LTTMSPRRRRASAAGLSFTTLAICSPVAVPHRAASAGATGTCAPAMPNQARRTRPVLISDAMILWVESLTGTASPRPTPATAVLTPTIRPRPSASAPPLLPGLSAASVWTTSSTTRPDFVGNDRPSPDTMPAVTLPARPSGMPTATTSWPTRRPPAGPTPTGAVLAACHRDGGGHRIVRLEDRQVPQHVAADDVDLHGGPVGERRFGAAGAG